MNFAPIIHKKITSSTNLDAKSGEHGCVYTADEQSAGRGRLNHSWHAQAGSNLLMSVVLEVAGLEAEHVSTFPLVAGYAVARAVASLLPAPSCRFVQLKWPNDVLFNGRKLAGILCERNGDKIICGIGVNVRERDFPEELQNRATSLIMENVDRSVTEVRDALLDELGKCYDLWKVEGFRAIYPRLEALDFLKGRQVEIVQTDDDANPVSGRCNGIAPCGALEVEGCLLAAGEAHVKNFESLSEKGRPNG